MEPIFSFRHMLGIINFQNSPEFMRLQRTYAKFGVSEKDCIQAVQEANEFFGLPASEILDAMDTLSKDKVIKCDFEQLMRMGMEGRKAFTLTITRENAQRKFKWVILRHWEKELVCDFFIGVRAGLNQMDVEAVRQGLANTPADKRHPEGCMRSEFIRIGLMHGRMNAVNNTLPCFDKYMEFLADALDRNKEQIQKDKMNFSKRTGIMVR